MSEMQGMENSLASYWARRFGGAEEKEAFVEAFDKVQTALAQGDTLVEIDAATLALNNPLLVADTRQGQSAAPLVFDGAHLWLQRIWQSERQLAKDIGKRLSVQQQAIVGDEQRFALYAQGLNAKQVQALKQASQQPFSMILGGPGTGKTFTLARIVALLHASDAIEHLALAAPTGKAAKRMEEALSKALAAHHWQGQIPQAQTLHRLLGIGSNGLAQYHHDNPLPYDVVIIDEASMLSLEMAAQLFAALSDDCRLILLGDANQLAAVEAGAVLQDLSRHQALQAVQVVLEESQRFHAQSGIGQLAQAVLQGEAREDSLLPLFDGDALVHQPLGAKTYQHLAAGYADYFQALAQKAQPQQLLAVFERYRILCASHHGALGAEKINQAMRYQALQERQAVDYQGFFHGLPLMISANDYHHEVFNGDIGLCVQGQDGRLQFVLPNKTLPLEQLNPATLQMAYALTIHKSQGSEFETVALVIDGGQEKLLSRELIYTGITRAKKRLVLYASLEDLCQAAQKPSQRRTGLSAFLSACA